MTQRTPRNTRKFRRMTVRMMVDYQAMGGIHCDYATTLGAGGMFLQTELPLRRGDLVKVRFRVPGNDTLHSIEAKVTWQHDAGSSPDGAARTPGVGLQFLNQNAINELARELEDYLG